MNNLEVVIDAGHGGSDPGAVANGLNEKDLNLEISKYMYEKFKEKGIPVKLIRNSDETISPTERTKKILDAFGNKKNVVVISNHINAAGSSTSTASGAEVIYALRNNDILAKNIIQALSNSGQKIRDYYQRRLPSDTRKDYYFIHRDTGITEPVIIEYGFIDNTTDITNVKDNYKKYVDAIVDAVIATKKGVVLPPVNNETYVVKSGDSLWSIAKKYNTTVNNIRELNNLKNDMLSIGQMLLLPKTSTGSENAYIVKSGDSLWNIANKYNTTVNSIKELNNLKNDNLSIGQVLLISNASVPPTTPNVPTTTYVVKIGDSLWGIANKYNTTVNTIKELNNLKNDNLSIGQVLKIPGSANNIREYVVKSGDSLWSIANRYNTTVNTIKELNNLKTDSLSIGQTLILP